MIPYKGNKLDENALTPCCKCECLILSDSSDPNNDKCIRIKKTPKDKHISSADKSQEAVKADEESVDKSTSTVDKPSRREQAQKEEKKRTCFRFCRKNKTDARKDKFRDDGIQTSKVALNNAKSQRSENDFVRDSTQSGMIGGGCNNNTIIFQKDPASGDGIANLENWLRMEAKANNRNFEDILNELRRQRREIQELKDMLDAVVRGLRQQMYMGAFGKTKNDFVADFGGKDLERKSNTLSIKKSDKGENKTDVSPAEATPSQSGEKKTKRFFPWCK